MARVLERTQACDLLSAQRKTLLTGARHGRAVRLSRPVLTRAISGNGMRHHDSTPMQRHFQSPQSAGYPLMPVSAKPRTKYCWNERNRMTEGMVAMAVPAMSTPQLMRV